MGVLIGSAVIPVQLSLIWNRMTARGMDIGTIGGTFLGLTAWLCTATTFSGGLSNFLANTGRYEAFTGNRGALSKTSAPQDYKIK